MALDNFDEDMVNEYRVKVTVRNNLILTAIEAAGFKNQSAFCREAGMPATALSGMISMKSPPLTSMGEFSDAAKKLMEILCLAPTDLWTSEQLTLKLRHNSAERDVNLDAMRSMLGIHAEEALLLLQPSPEDLAAEKDILPLIEEQLDSLTPREAKVMRLRYGIGCQEHTLEEAGEVLGVTRERVRQIENKAMRKLKHPQRADVLAQLTERYRPDGLQKFNLD